MARIFLYEVEARNDATVGAPGLYLYRVEARSEVGRPRFRLASITARIIAQAATLKTLPNLTVDSFTPVVITAEVATGTPDSYRWRVVSGSGVAVNGVGGRSQTITAPPLMGGGSVVIGVRPATGTVLGPEVTTTITVRPHTLWTRWPGGGTWVGVNAGGFVSQSTTNSVPVVPAGATLAWEDDFDGAAGTQPSATSWNLEHWPAQANGELAHYTNRPENVDFDGAGNLRIRAYAESFGELEDQRDYTSARITTEGKVDFDHGYFVARIKFPAGQGLWPAFWLLGNSVGDAWWPEAGEIDIIEALNQMTTSYQVIHGGDGREPPSYTAGDESHWQLQQSAPHSPSLAQDYHLYAVRWTFERIEFLIDNVTTRVFTRAMMPTGKTWPFDRGHGFHVILNLAVGGWPGNPDADTFAGGPREMLVDWVRAYSLPA